MPFSWLTHPVELHSWREAPPCELTPEQCAYQSGYWRWWYEADHRYALPTVALLLVAIILFTIANAFVIFAPAKWHQNRLLGRLLSYSRLLSYTSWRCGNWNTHSLGAYMLASVGFVFFFAMLLGPRPYYWPNTDEVNFGGSPPIATRAGWMSLACLPFVLILSTKANPIATLTGYSHEKLIVWHNWVAWAMFVLALVHTFPFIVYNIRAGDIVMQWSMGGLWPTGVIALIAQAWLTFMSIRWVRNAYYEFFKALHFLVAPVFIVFLFLHCDHVLSSWDYFIAAGVLYTLSWLYSQCRVFMEHGFRHRAEFSLATKETVKITIKTRALWRPGQHIYVRFLALGMHSLTAHPFTICSLPTFDDNNEMVLYVKRHGGLTGRLLKLAVRDATSSIPVLLDGPYGGLPARWYDGFGVALVVGGGSGIGFALSLAQHFLETSKSRQGNPQMILVLSSRDEGAKQWCIVALEKMVSEQSYYEDGSSLNFRVQIHYTGGDSSDSGHDEERKVEGGALKQSKSERNDGEMTEALEITSSTSRPDIHALTAEVASIPGSSVGLVVCGPSSMAHDMGQSAALAQRNILAGRAAAREVWYHTESFSS
ncbi:ferric-chelate reductase [Stachybotrys elegans]|uniref:ferric-chelate reductase (NADPH) n=1 Tax=Stachybotrys elegans TaxID=80388 RepID=A0A8K0SH07_9HYPO|nr:ferric-chelate reductase [Stachybotrys elegans]